MRSSIFVAACRILICSRQDLLVVTYRVKFPDQGSNPEPLHWEHLSHWTTREIPPFPLIFVLTPLNAACMCYRFSCIRLFVTPWTIALQVPLSIGFSRKEYWSKLPCPPAGDLPNWGIKAMSLMSPALAGGFFTTSATWEVQNLTLPEIISFPSLSHFTMHFLVNS